MLKKYIDKIPSKGAGLDFIKLYAAVFMVVDHVNKVFLGMDFTLELLGRAVFPLFALVTALHIRRGIDPKSYIETLLPLGMVSQIPFVLVFLNVLYQGDFSSMPLNVIFTLGIGGWIAAHLKDKSLWFIYPSFVLAFAYWYFQPHVLFEYNVLGLMLPFAFVLLLENRRGGFLISLLLLFLVNTEFSHWENYFSGVEAYQIVFELSLSIFIAILVGMLACLCVARIVEDKKRFLPRYSLHIFYPAHLFIIWGISFLEKVELF